jgi:hypothetical protein
MNFFSFCHPCGLSMKNGGGLPHSKRQATIYAPSDATFLECGAAAPHSVRAR